MTLHLTGAFEVIILPNKRVTAFLHHFFLRFNSIQFNLLLNFAMIQEIRYKGMQRKSIKGKEVKV